MTMLKNGGRLIGMAMGVVCFGISAGFSGTLPKASKQAIIKSLQDSQLEVRVAAAQALTLVPEEAAAKPLENALIASSEIVEQEALVKALVAADDSGSVKRLSDALANPQFTWGAGSKPRAIEVIGKIGKTKVLKWLTDLLASEQEPAVRAAAIRALGDIGAPPKKEEKK
jgi:HEAT repeat protein